jgi:hypothetical protein
MHIEKHLKKVMSGYAEIVKRKTQKSFLQNFFSVATQKQLHPTNSKFYCKCFNKCKKAIMKLFFCDFSLSAYFISIKCWVVLILLFKI